MELVVFDLDGTLLNKHQALSPFTLETLEAMRDKKFFIPLQRGAHIWQRESVSSNIIFKSG
jgi:Predicted hydrolases of the HAD superfamily